MTELTDCNDNILGSIDYIMNIIILYLTGGKTIIMIIIILKTTIKTLLDGTF